MTKAKYLEDSYLFSLPTTLHSINIVQDDEVKQGESKCNNQRLMILVLNETIFHPQGGGQPSDTGRIEFINRKGWIFHVKHVQKSKQDSERIEHIGSLECENDSISSATGDDALVNHVDLLLKELKNGEPVNCVIDQEKRLLNIKLHSAGHLLDVAVRNISSGSWHAGKGYHFPESPYVEYNIPPGFTLDPKNEDSSSSVEKKKTKAKNIGLDMDELAARIQKEMDDILKNENQLDVKVEYLPSTHQRCKIFTLPPNVDTIRLVTYCDAVTCPCSGTHVNHVKEIGRVVVKKLKKKKNTVRVSYHIE